MTNETMALNPHVVTHIDILGYSNMVSDSQQIELLFDAVNKLVNNSNSISKLMNRHSSHVDVHQFSDNIAISSDYYSNPKNDDERKNNTYSIMESITLASYLQKKLMCEYGIMIRGAIVLGDLYHSSNIIFGNGIVKAVQMGDKKIKYPDGCPRILVEEDLITNYIRDIKVEYPDITDKKLGRVFIKDVDGKTYLHYISASIALESIIGGNSNTDLYTTLKKHQNGVNLAFERIKNTIEKDTSTKQNLSEKYEWLEKYHNMVCEPSAPKLMLNNKL